MTNRDSAPNTVDAGVLDRTKDNAEEIAREALAATGDVAQQTMSAAGDAARKAERRAGRGSEDARTGAVARIADREVLGAPAASVIVAALVGYLVAYAVHARR